MPKIRNLFFIGSPFGLFAAQKNLPSDEVLPPNELVSRLYNIYTPVDPVAYRIGKIISKLKAFIAIHKKYGSCQNLKIFSLKHIELI